jgi:hypothetical protein
MGSALETTTMPCHSILFLLLLPLTTAAAAPAPVAEKLYRPAPVSSTAIADPWDLFLTVVPSPSDRTRVKVILKRRDKAAIGDLLLTLSATNTATKSTSHRQKTLRLDAGQREAMADFVVENPGCGPAKVVAALFQHLEPLARAEKTLRFGCRDPAQ